MLRTLKNKKLLWAFLILISGINTYLFWSFTADDAYILYRYGFNLVEHGIWNYNPSLVSKEEAYTSFLAAFLSSLPIILGFKDPSFFFKTLNLAILFLGVLLVIKREKGWRWGLLWLFVNSFFWIHLLSGMETGLFILVLAALALIQTKEKEDSIGSYLALILPFIRPEGLIFSLLYIVNRKISRGAIFSILLIWTGYFAWRWMYFESFLPNPLIVKSFSTFKGTIWLYNLWSCKFYLLALLISIFCESNKNHKKFLWGGLFILVFFYGPSNLMMNFADRFFNQIAVPLILVSLLLKPRPSFVLISSLVLVNLISFFPNPFFPILPYGNRMDETYKELGKALNESVDQRFNMVCGDAGAIPFFSGWQNYDPNGLSSKDWIEKENHLDLLKKVEADLVFAYYRNERLFLRPGMDNNKELKKFFNSKGYTEVGLLRFSPINKIKVFGHPDLQNEKILIESLERICKESQKSLPDWQNWYYDRYQELN